MMALMDVCTNLSATKYRSLCTPAVGIVSFRRMLIVLYVEKPGQEYDKILDILFLCVGLLHPAGMHLFFLLSLLVLLVHFLKIISTVVCRAG